MKAPTIYLSFSGNCKEAFDYYAEVLGGKISMVSHYRDMPPSPDYPPVPEAHHDLVMHITLDLVSGSIIQGSDMAPGFGPLHQQGNNFSISLQMDSRNEADKIHAALSDRGEITMPLQETFWGAYFGSCRDRFGINWMIALNKEQNS